MNPSSIVIAAFLASAGVMLCSGAQALADFLAGLDCDCLQGYLFARPGPLEQWLAVQLATVTS